MDSVKAKQFATLIETAINAVLKDHGFDCEVKGGTLGARDVLIPKLTIKPIGHDLQKHEFLTYAHVYGCTESDYQRVVTVKKEEFRIVGFDPNRRKYPVTARRVSDDKEIYLTIESLDQFRTKLAFV